MAGQRVLLLQGPVGTFFADLRDALHRAGADARHIVFNGADALYARRHARRGTVLRHTGSHAEWARMIEAQLTHWQPHAIVLFGCERERHRIARDHAARHDVPVLSLEEGYVRPGYVTAEWGGNNRASPVARLPVQALEVLAERPMPAPHGRDAFDAMAWAGGYYYVVHALSRPLFPQARHHKDRPLRAETAAWLRSAWRKRSHRAGNAAICNRLLQRGDFTLIPLQVRDDAQLVASGRGWTNERLVERATASFAAHAPPERQLLFKIHPLERGHSDMRHAARDIARRHGVRDRVFVIDEGPLGELTSAASSMLTINSTSAFSALARGTALAVVGDAMFRRPDLAFCVDDAADLDRFWRDARPPEPHVALAFRHAVERTALLPGDYYMRAARAGTVANVIVRLVAGPPDWVSTPDVLLTDDLEAARMAAQ